MRRREFITLVGGSALAWPFAARAQQPDRMRRVGVLMARDESDPEGQKQAAALRTGLQDVGWKIGQSLDLDFRWAVGDARDGARAGSLCHRASVGSRRALRSISVRPARRSLLGSVHRPKPVLARCSGRDSEEPRCARLQLMPHSRTSD
jgi:hypothetical protein